MARPIMQKGAGDNRGTEARFGGRFGGQKQKNEKKLCFLPFKTLSATVKDSFSIFFIDLVGDSRGRRGQIS